MAMGWKVQLRSGAASCKLFRVCKLYTSKNHLVPAVSGESGSSWLILGVIWTDPQVKEQLETSVLAKQAGVACVMGHSYIKARKNSSFVKNLVIDVYGRTAGDLQWP